MQTDEELLTGAMARINRSMAGIGAGGSLGLLAAVGWPWGAGFALGAAVSWLNFRWLKQVVDALGGKRPKARLAIFMGLRYLLMCGGAYAIVKYSNISLSAALAGLFVAVAAVILEILFQLIYARS
jgi:hypothetical protein